MLNRKLFSLHKIRQLSLISFCANHRDLWWWTWCFIHSLNHVLLKFNQERKLFFQSCLIILYEANVDCLSDFLFTTSHLFSLPLFLISYSSLSTTPHSLYLREQSWLSRVHRRNKKHDSNLFFFSLQLQPSQYHLFFCNLVLFLSPEFLAPYSEDNTYDMSVNVGVMCGGSLFRYY